MDNIEEFITYKGCIYKKVCDVNSLIKICPNCKKQYFTKEQRQIYCCGTCKTQAFRAKQIKQAGIVDIIY
jgi:ribosomal protein L37AE/L43A|tara:strand:+ start:387 stop:596 length:210 start_codon:yes stop_codon:yes gene_type:complete